MPEHEKALVNWIDNRTLASNPRIQIATNGRPMSAQVSVSNSEMLKMILEYYTGKNDVIADLTYGFGNFWNTKPYRKNLLYADINPTKPFVRKIDFNETGLESESIDCIVFDPPYAVRNYSFDYRNRGKNEAEKVVYSEDDSYWKSDGKIPEKEFARILKSNGIVVHKHCNIEPVLELFKQIDIFFSVTPFAQASIKMHKSRPNYSVWHVLQKIE